MCVDCRTTTGPTRPEARDRHASYPSGRRTTDVKFSLTDPGGLYNVVLGLLVALETALGVIEAALYLGFRPF